MPKMPKNAESFLCDLCDFKCCKNSNFITHINTAKHKNRTKLNNFEQQNAEQSFICNNCNKEYKARSSLWYHQKKCNNLLLINNTNNTNNQTNDKSEVQILTNLVLDVVKQNKELTYQNQDLTNKMFELCKNGINNTLINNSNNKTFNLNVFLNEQCKDAMNIMDFVDSLKLQLSDLENVGKLGFVDGISNIIVKNLKELDVHKRPVHCSDSKREVMYIKDENRWEKDNDENKKLRKAIKHIAHKNTKLLTEFKDKYPDCGKSESKHSEQYSKMIVEAMGGRGDNDLEKEDRIIKNIAKEVIIDKQL
uniref:C2H2-type domain-containing protein n=1 Tax=viral metagenome TaxID=1070528 RepID=A0A6C0EQ14_9ZZZZ